jgi:hypothetical protein
MYFDFVRPDGFSESSFTERSEADKERMMTELKISTVNFWEFRK